MADDANQQTTMDSLREELANLRSQLEGIVKNVDERRQDITADVARKIAKEMDHYRAAAAHRASQLRDAGEAGLDEAAARVRQNPLASILVAFGVGWVLSCLFRHLR